MMNNTTQRLTAFDRSIREQIAINQARTPTERLEALGDLLEFARTMAPTGAEAQERRRRIHAARERERDQLRAFLRGLIVAQSADPYDHD